jgi:hypothetical protein
MQHAGSTNVFLLPSPEAFRASDFSNAMFLSDKSPFVYVTPPHAMARPLQTSWQLPPCSMRAKAPTITRTSIDAHRTSSAH